MCMPVMERRLQWLLDRRRFELVEAESRASGRSIAAVIREAIDARFGADVEVRRRAAAEVLVAMNQSTDGPAFGLDDFRADMDSLWSEELAK